MSMLAEQEGLWLGGKTEGMSWLYSGRLMGPGAHSKSFSRRGDLSHKRAAQYSRKGFGIWSAIFV